MASSASPVPLKVRTSADPDALHLHRGHTAPVGARAVQPASSPSPRAVWESVWLVAHQQVGQDAMLLWRHTRRDDHLQLIAAAPAALGTPEVVIAADDPVRQLSSGRLDLLAHLRCTADDGEMERVLADLGLRAAVSTILCGDEEGTILVTAGFRRRWQLSAPHAPAVSALVEYLRVCQEAALGPQQPHLSTTQHPWWELRSEAPTLWQQAYRPSVLRTVHDLTQTLAEAARAMRPRFDLRTLAAAAALPSPEVARALAHRSADLMERLESIYFGPAVQAGFDELLSQALLLVRDAYHLCRGTWPGCLAVVRQRPAAIEGPAGDLRHQLIDWVAHHIEAEHAAD